MNRCNTCKYFFRDWSVGTDGCSNTESMTDEEFDEYEVTGSVDDCQHYEFDTSLLDDRDKLLESESEWFYQHDTSRWYE